MKENFKEKIFRNVLTLFVCQKYAVLEETFTDGLS